MNQFVSKDDKHAVEMFVIDSLSTQVKGLLQLDDDKITEGLDAHIEDFRKVMEKSFVSGQQKQAQRKRRFKDKPDGWDSDLDGHWNAQPDAIEDVPVSPVPTNSGRGRGQPASGVVLSDDDGDEPPVQKAPAKRTAAATRTTKAAPAKKPAAAKKATAPKKAPARGRKKANPFQDSDEEEEEEDVIMDDDDGEPEPPARVQPTRATRETRTRAGAKTKQTTLNFSQSQKPKATQKSIEISDDEISEDDAFETMPASRSRRR